MRTPEPAGPGAISPAIVARLQQAVEARQGRHEGAEWRFLCPAHDDYHPSARWNPAKAVWCCDLCDTSGGALDLAKALGIPVPKRGPPALTVADLAAAKGLDADFLRGLGVTDGVAGRERSKCVDVPYMDAAGEVLAVRKRLRLTGEPRFRWRRGDHVIPYGLWRLSDAPVQGQLVLVEGESDAWTLWAASIPALGLPGASTWKPQWASHLDGIAGVYVWREPDRGGDSLAAKVARDLPEVRIIEASIEAKDPNALWLRLNRDADAFRQRMQELMAAARPASEIRAEALTAETCQAFDKARHLLDSPDLLARIADAIREDGYAGDTTPAVLCYITFTSRLLERPLNLTVIAPSAAGKNRAVDAARALMPGSVYVLIEASSPRALIYTDDQYENRTVIFAEADSIPEDRPAASAIRALAADNAMAYHVTERDPDTGQFTTRHIVKPGPTGLITTSTKPLPWQMDTRTLTVSLSDAVEQTREVMQAHAAAVAGGSRTTDVDPFLALQRWLELAGNRRVVVPFADALAKVVPAEQVRMRRDFRQLLTAIQTVALLYQRQRERDAEGRIIATLEDYGLARKLLLDVFQTAATGGVTQAVRETVEAVASLYDGQNPVTVKATGDRLGLAKNSTLYRVRQAIARGYLINLETAKARPAKVVPGDPLPQDRPALPKPEDLNFDRGPMGVMVVYADHPETIRTVKPHPLPLTCPTSESVVQAAVQEPSEPPFEPLAAANSNTNSLAMRQAVQRFESRMGDGHAPANGQNADGDTLPDTCAGCGSPSEYRDNNTGVW